MFLGINAYNNTVGKYCSLDSDCKVACGQGSLNNKGISLEDPFIIFVSGCSEMDWAICKNNKCETFNVMNAASLEDCDRIADQFLKSNCYYHLARNLSDVSICSKIESTSFRESCIRQI
ncbi:MAG: hypothetical protein QXF88_01240 [Candidatus Aenigmatarchaeota archaeon]